MMMILVIVDMRSLIILVLLQLRHVSVHIWRVSSSNYWRFLDAFEVADF